MQEGIWVIYRENSRSADEYEGGGGLNVHFYNSSMIYGFRTEQELKGVEAVQQGIQMGGMS